MKSKLTFLLFICFFAIAAHAQNRDSLKTPFQDDNTEVPIIVEDSSSVFQIVETMPEFPGGQDKMYDFITKNLNYPKLAKENGIQGKVFVSFVVEKDGRISNVKCIKDIGSGCGEECVRIIKKMPNWKPGTQGGKFVRVQFNLPFIFKLDDSESGNKK